MSFMRNKTYLYCFEHLNQRSLKTREISARSLKTHLKKGEYMFSPFLVVQSFYFLWPRILSICMHACSMIDYEDLFNFKPKIVMTSIIFYSTGSLCFPFDGNWWTVDDLIWASLQPIELLLPTVTREELYVPIKHLATGLRLIRRTLYYNLELWVVSILFCLSWTKVHGSMHPAASIWGTIRVILLL